MTQKINAAGLQIVKHFEGLKLKAYPDPKTGGAPWTIGRGHTGPDVHEGMTCTEEQADQWLMQGISRAEDIANKYWPGLLTDNGFSAVVSALYNIGEGGPHKDGLIYLKSGSFSTFFRLLGYKNFLAASDELLKWCDPNDPSVHAGLLRRRSAERALFRGEPYEPFLV